MLFRDVYVSPVLFDVLLSNGVFCSGAGTAEQNGAVREHCSARTLDLRSQVSGFRSQVSGLRSQVSGLRQGRLHEQGCKMFFREGFSCNLFLSTCGRLLRAT